MSPPPAVRIKEVHVFSRPVKTRIPFRYGKAVVTEEPIAHLRVAAEVDGTVAEGVSAAALPPLWFDKDSSKTHDDNIRDLLRSVRHAADVYAEIAPTDAWSLHRASEPEARRRCAAEGLNELTAGFGVALLDEAAIDAICRKKGVAFHRGLRENLFGLGADFGRLVPESPRSRIAVRHTVGMADPITAADVAGPIGDGLPETLEDVIRTYGVRYFKVKTSKDIGASLERLRRIATVLDRDAGDYGVTLDGNEQFDTMEEAAGFVRRVAADAALAGFWRRTLWIEQPVDRSASLVDGVASALKEISAAKPVIIDESDGTDDAVDRALALGYHGISAKNCKGVYRTLHSHRRAKEAGAILSSEDLMNTPIVPLHQDLCVAAALGIPHSERNGHHYIRAFRYFSPREREDAVRDFPSLYGPGPDGLPALRIEAGELSLSEINSFAFGVKSLPDWANMIKQSDMIK